MNVKLEISEFQKNIHFILQLIARIINFHFEFPEERTKRANFCELFQLFGIVTAKNILK